MVGGEVEDAACDDGDLREEMRGGEKMGGGERRWEAVGGGGRWWEVVGEDGRRWGDGGEI